MNGELIHVATAKFMDPAVAMATGSTHHEFLLECVAVPLSLSDEQTGGEQVHLSLLERQLAARLDVELVLKRRGERS